MSETTLSVPLKTTPMIEAFEAAYSRDWSDPAGDEIKEIWHRAWQAAAQAAPAAVGPVLDSDWRFRMLDGTAIERDDMGCGEHPALPVLEEGMKPKQFFDALGIDLQCVMADDQMDMDAYEAMLEVPDYNAWIPSAPEGQGWKQVAIFDTEDGPACWWIREAPPSPPLRAAVAATPATESVLIEGVANTIPESVALELLRLNIELRQAEVQAEPVAWINHPVIVDCAGNFAGYGNPELSFKRPASGLAFDKAQALYTAPQAQPADALDADGEAFRTAAKLGLTLRFYGGCAQPSKPRTPSAYAEVAGPDPAASMQEAVQRVKTTIDAALAAAQEGSDSADQGLPLLQEGRESGYGTCTFDYDMSAAQAKNEE